MKVGSHRAFFWFSFFSIAALVLAACAPAATPTAAPAAPITAPVATTAPVSTSAAVPVTGGEAAINVVNDPKLGQILVNGQGMTLYAFTKDGPNQSNCTGQCLKNWPALITQGNPTLGTGVDASMIGNATLASGSKIVTYNKMPLYTFFKDTKPGDTNGQGVGSVWFTISPAGQLVQPAASGTSPAGTEESATSVATSMATAPAAAASNEAVINVVNDPKLGQILVGANGMTLYAFTKDAPDKSNCSANCLKAWPPLVTMGSPTLGSGVDASLVGSTTDVNGDKMVTYNHMPLYYYKADQKAGDTNGQGVGSVWFTVSPDGKLVQQQASSQTQY